MRPLFLKTIRLIKIEKNNIMSNVNIEVKDNGPFLLKGDINLIDADGQTFDTNKPAVALCRCGASGNNPFCDGTHKKIDFESTPRAS
jgi:CDGSH-type Zn-finger protein